MSTTLLKRLDPGFFTNAPRKAVHTGGGPGRFANWKVLQSGSDSQLSVSLHFVPLTLRMLRVCKVSNQLSDNR